MDVLRRRSSRFVAAWFAVLLGLCAGTAAGATKRWNGSADIWNLDSAWTPAGIPQSGDDLVFPTVAANTTNTMDIPGTPVFNSILFTGLGYEISTPRVVNPPALGMASLTIAPSAVGATFNVAIVLTSDLTITHAGALTLVLGRPISGTGGVTIHGSGLVRYGQLGNSYTGPTTVLGGTLELPSLIVFGPASAIPGALIIGDETSGAGAAAVTRTGAHNIFDNAAVTVNPSGLLLMNNFSESIGSLSGSGPVLLGTAVLTLLSNDSNTFSGVISGSGGLEKFGSGTLTLSGSNTYSGVTTLQEGSLIINGVQASSDIEVRSGSLEVVLGGSGHIGELRPLSGEFHLEPGPPIFGPGILTSGNATLSSSGHVTGFFLDLITIAPGTGHDQLNVVGSVDLGSSTFPVLNSIGNALPPGSTMAVINNDSVDPTVGQFMEGNFDPLPEGGTTRRSEFVLRFSYIGGTGNDVTVTFVGRVGDVNADGSVNVVDVFSLLSFLFGSGPLPLGVADIDDDGTIDVRDVFLLINQVF